MCNGKHIVRAKKAQRAASKTNRKQGANAACKSPLATLDSFLVKAATAEGGAADGASELSTTRTVGTSLSAVAAAATPAAPASQAAAAASRADALIKRRNKRIEKNKRRLCRFIRKGEVCPEGDLCGYRHVMFDPTTGCAAASAQPASMDTTHDPSPSGASALFLAKCSLEGMQMCKFWPKLTELPQLMH